MRRRGKWILSGEVLFVFNTIDLYIFKNNAQTWLASAYHQITSLFIAYFAFLPPFLFITEMFREFSLWVACKWGILWLDLNNLCRGPCACREVLSLCFCLSDKCSRPRFFFSILLLLIEYWGSLTLFYRVSICWIFIILRECKFVVFYWPWIPCRVLWWKRKVK